jgi:hypothetical protein
MSDLIVFVFLVFLVALTGAITHGLGRLMEK